MTKTFANASNAARAARKVFGAHAVRGVDFNVISVDAGEYSLAPVAPAVLTERSTAVGYGKKCSENYGLPYPTAKEARAAGFAHAA